MPTRHSFFSLRALALAIAWAAPAGVILAEPHAADALETSEEVVARLGTTEIKAAEVKDIIRNLDPSVRQQAAKDPQLLGRVVRIELARIAVLGEAKEKHWDQQPDVVAQIERARSQTILASYLASVAAPPASYPSEAEVKTAYDQNRDRFTMPRQYHLAHIFVALPAGDDKKAEEAAEKKAEELARKARAKSGAFEEIARRNSDLPEAARNSGDLGWKYETQLLPEIKSVVAGMSKNEISDAIRTPTGWHIIQLLDTKAAGPQPLSEIHDSLVQYMRQRKLDENEQAYLAGLLENKHAAINEIALSKLIEQAK
jgi:parvulin-like peptidyl-prolyl isomerase